MLYWEKRREGAEMSFSSFPPHWMITVNLEVVCSVLTEGYWLALNSLVFSALNHTVVNLATTLQLQ